MTDNLRISPRLAEMVRTLTEQTRAVLAASETYSRMVTEAALQVLGSLDLPSPPPESDTDDKCQPVPEMRTAGTQEQRWVGGPGNPAFAHSFDAMVWAEAFADMIGSRSTGPWSDPGFPSRVAAVSTMVTWFANALMRGYDTGYAKAVTDGHPKVASGVSTDPKEWAEQFADYWPFGDDRPSRDDVVSAMSTWFANAIEAGRDEWATVHGRDA